MISKLVKARESWIFKSIFVAVAISFISLFGVSGISVVQHKTKLLLMWED